MKILTLLFSLFIFNTSLAQDLLAEHHFESDEITEVSVMGSFCDVYVSRGDRVVFDGRIEGSGDQDDYIIASVKSGNKVLFKVEAKSKKWSDWNNVKTARLDIVIPNNVLLKIDNTSGDVRLNDLDGVEYKIGATSGDIAISRVSGTVKIKSTSGDITLKQLTGEIESRSTSGDQDIYNITGNLSVQATSGDLDIRAVKGNMKAVATSGDIEIVEVEGALSMETTSGNMQGRRIRLTGDSDVRATSGDVSFTFLNDLKDVGFDLRATSGDLEVGSISGEDKLVLQRGSILWKGVTTSGDQEYAAD